MRLPFRRVWCHDRVFPLKSALLVKAVIPPCMYIPTPFPLAAPALMQAQQRSYMAADRKFWGLASLTDWPERVRAGLRGGRSTQPGRGRQDRIFQCTVDLDSFDHQITYLEGAERKKLRIYLSSFHGSSSPVTDWQRSWAMLILVVSWPYIFKYNKIICYYCYNIIVIICYYDLLESSNKAALTTVMILFDAFGWAIYPLSQLCRKEGKYVSSTGVSTLRLLIAEWLRDNYSRCLMSTRWLSESSLCCCSLDASIWWWRRLPSNDEVTVSDQSSISHQKTREQSNMGLVGGWLCWELSSLLVSALQTLCAFAISWQPVIRKRRVTGFPPKSVP